MRLAGWLLGFSLAAGMAAADGAEKAAPAGSGNAALRYWMAFAVMENPPAGGDVAGRLERVAEGLEPWSESLAPIVEKNREALATLQRGTRLASCDWGLEHDLGAEAPIAYVPRARALARLNVLQGVRLWQQGRLAEAVDSWLAGVRFSRDIAADAPMIGALVAGSSLRAHLGALARAIAERRLDAAALSRIEAEIAGLPEAGFDWSVAARHESEAASALASRIASAPDPVALLQRYFGPTAAGTANRQAVRESWGRARSLNDDLRPQLIAGLRMPYESSRAAIGAVDGRVAAEPTLRLLTPSLGRYNDARGQAIQARAELLTLLRGR